MQVLIPYAASHAPACQALLPSLQLPQLQKLLAGMAVSSLDAGDELSLSPPHERALARALGLPDTDGLIPWAAWQAHQQADLADLGGGWAFVSLCNWQLNSQQVSMRQIPLHDLPAAESDALLAAMRPYFLEDGLTLYPDTPGRWLAHGAALAQLASASIVRVLGRNVQPWLLHTDSPGLWARLQSEMQMLLYTHPVNDARLGRGALPANALWLSGCGALVPHGASAPTAPPKVLDDLRDAALTQNWPAWVLAWQQLDASHIHALCQAQSRGETIQLTLCGERQAQTWSSQKPTLLQRIRGVFGLKPIHHDLNTL